ncbi:MAG: YhfZ family protein, partial [Nakamurella sp.]
MSEPVADSTPLVTALQPAVRRIATDALALGPGATLPTNAAYLKDNGIGAGTIQRALNLLRDRSAVTITSRGHLGRTIDTVDVGQAWQAAGLAPVRLLLPPAGPAEIDVLEQALAQDLTGLGIPHTVRHQSGGAGRLDAIARGSDDIAVVSAGVVNERGSAGTAPSLQRELPAGTYYAAGRLAVVRRTDKVDQPVKRVAIDHRSPDHVVLTCEEFPPSDDLTLVEISFPNVPAAVLRGDVDAGIWHITKSLIPLDLAGLTVRPLQQAD